MMYDEALRCESTDTTVLLSRSFAQMMSTPPRLDLALQDADAVIRQCPTSWHGWLQKGETHLRMGDSKEAEEALVKAVGFAQGVDKLTAQKSLADMQSRRGQASPAAGPSVHSTSPVPISEHSLQTAPHSTSTTVLSHTPSVMQTSSTTSPTTTISASKPPGPSNTQASSTPNTPTSGKLTLSTTLN